MIDEHRQDLAAEYALDALDAESARAFEAMLANDPELKALTDDLRETAATLASDAPKQLPPPELRERVLSRIRAEAQTSTEPAPSPVTATPAPPKGGGNLLPWALAAGFAITTGALWMERSGLQQETAGLIRDLHDLRTEDTLKKMQIATLSAQVDAYAKATAVIVWDEKNQRGVLKLANVPPPAAGKDYQLWVIDPKYPQPVSGGVVPVDQDGLSRVSFTPDQPIRKADKFAISVEPTGGVPKPTGQIVFLGD
jgi:anti-sigma-K factor RskA